MWDSANSQWIHVADVPVPPGPDVARTYEVKGLTAGATYYYRVAAVNSQGTGPYSEYVAASTAPSTRPHTPTLTATATGPYTIELTWNIPADNGTTLVGFEIEKWGETTPGDTAIDLGWVVLGDDVNTDAGDHQSATATQTFYVDTDLDSNTRYDYRIKADNGRSRRQRQRVSSGQCQNAHRCTGQAGPDNGWRKRDCDQTHMDGAP